MNISEGRSQDFWGSGCGMMKRILCSLRFYTFRRSLSKIDTTLKSKRLFTKFTPGKKTEVCSHCTSPSNCAAASAPLLRPNITSSISYMYSRNFLLWTRFVIKYLCIHKWLIKRHITITDLNNDRRREHVYVGMTASTNIEHLRDWGTKRRFYRAFLHQMSVSEQPVFRKWNQ